MFEKTCKKRLPARVRRAAGYAKPVLIFRTPE
jgi:hypothetical protein